MNADTPAEAVTAPEQAPEYLAGAKALVDALAVEFTQHPFTQQNQAAWHRILAVHKKMVAPPVAAKP